VTSVADSSAAGTVIGQSPAACTACADAGDPVDLTVSTGPAPVLIDVGTYTGQTQTAAEAAIVADGLSVGTVTSVADSSAAGTVIGQSPTACTACANAGDPVDLTVSTGPAAMSDVPDVTGLAQATAEADIVAAGLTVGNVTQARNFFVPVGDVIWQTPQDCTACVPPGTAVDLQVSTGATAGDPNAKGSAMDLWSLILLMSMRLLRGRRRRDSMKVRKKDSG
jgi:beta-lactam-binding protein with PASTA domain